MQRLLVRAAIDIVPPPVRSFPNLRGRGLRKGEALLAQAVGGGANVVALPSLPPAQAVRRMREAGRSSG